MLIATITFLALYVFGGGASTAEIKKGIKDTIEKGEHRSAAIAIVEDAETDLSVYNKDLSAREKSLEALGKQHATDEAELAPILDAIEAQLSASEKRLTDMRFELKDELSREEWAGVFVVEEPAGQEPPGAESSGT